MFCLRKSAIIPLVATCSNIVQLCQEDCIRYSLIQVPGNREQSSGGRYAIFVKIFVLVDIIQQAIKDSLDDSSQGNSDIISWKPDGERWGRNVTTGKTTSHCLSDKLLTRN